MNRIKLTGFLSYAHKDSEYYELFLEGLRSHLKHSINLDLDIWDDSKIPLGEDWKEIITGQIEKSDFAILLVSANFLASDFIKKEEFLRFVKLQKAKGFRFFTVLLSACNISQWEELSKTQFFYAKGRDYNLPKATMVYYGDLVRHDGDGVILPNAAREKYHNDFARELEQVLVSNFSKSNKTKIIELTSDNDEPVASVNAVRKFHGSKNLEEYVSVFEEATGFQDFVVELQGSIYHPKIIIPEIRTDFDFLGHGASKWTNEFTLLDSAIERIKKNGGSSRFMIFAPWKSVGLVDHEVASTTIEERTKILKSLLALKRLKHKHNRNKKEVQVRLYSEFPNFRLAFINHQIVLVGHYNGHTRNSNESPILVFNSDKHWSFYSAFQAMYDARWKSAKNLDSVWDKLQTLYAELGIDTSIS